MSNNTRLYLALPVLLVLFLLPRGCDAVAAITHRAPDGCQQAVFSPESAPAGSHFFGDGSGNMQLSAEDMATAFKQSAACDPYQVSVREMAWGLEQLPDEAARFARQQYLASDMGALTEASKRINQIVDSSTFTVNSDWSGSYETLYAAATQDGWHAYKLHKSMAHETVMIQTTAGNRVFIWKVKCLWQPVARILRGYPVGPPQGVLPPGQKPPKPTPNTQPPGTGTRPPSVPPSVPPTSPPGCRHNCTPPTTRPPGCRHNCTPPTTRPGKDPSQGIGNNAGAAGQGDTGHRAGGDTPANPPVETQPPATYGTTPSPTTQPPVTSPPQPPITSPVTTPDTAPD